MRRNFRFQWCIILLVVFIAGCKVRRPSDVLPESTMENLLYDYHIAKAMGDNLPYNENYKKVLYADAVFKKYGTNKAVFDSSMVWYTRNTDVLAKIYEKVSKRLKAQQNSINHLIAIRDKKPMTSEPGDSIDVWAWERMKRLTGMPTDNKLTFVLPSDTNFKERDTLVWEVRYRFLEGKPDTTLAALMAMQITYENDSIISKTKKISGSGVQSISLQSDTLGTIREVKGFIYYPREKTPRTLLTDQITLMRYHSNDTLYALNDSLKNDSLKLKPTKEAKIETKENADAVQNEQQPQRLTPEEMNRRRSNQQRAVKPEQLQIEKHIQMEKHELKQEQPINQRRRIQQKQIQ
ncbi:DUF4296 domain-containing protein [Bacteroides sp.]